MARRIKNFLKGVIGPLNFRELNGKQIVSTKTPKGTIKHTPNTKRASNTFGIASSLGGELRELFKPSILGLTESSMVNRMNVKLIQIFSECRDPVTRHFQFDTSSFEQLNDFDFNFKSPLRKSLQDKPIFNWQEGNLNFSCGSAGAALKLKFPSSSTSCEVMVSVALFRLDAGMRTYSTLKQIAIVKKKEPFVQGIDLNFAVPPGCLYVAGVFLRFYSSNRNSEVLVNTKKFSPARICSAAFTPGSFEEMSGYKWVLMSALQLDYDAIVPES